MPYKKCKHKMRKDHCRDCKADNFCKHDRARYSCVKCNGKGVCEHRRLRTYCSLCNPEGSYNIYVRNETRKGRSLPPDFMTLETFLELIKRCCWFCKRTPEQSNGMGIDRIDNSLGHVLGNIEPCCFVCNHMRSDTPREEFLAQCARIVAARKV
jgi:hypothetical protein